MENKIFTKVASGEDSIIDHRDASSNVMMACVYHLLLASVDSLPRSKPLRCHRQHRRSGFLSNPLGV